MFSEKVIDPSTQDTAVSETSTNSDISEIQALAVLGSTVPDVVVEVKEEEEENLIPPQSGNTAYSTRSLNEELHYVRRFGQSPFRRIKARTSHHMSYWAATLEAFFASTSFSTPTMTALVGKLALPHSDLWGVAGMGCATPGFLLFRNGTREMNESVLTRLFYCFRPYDLLTVGISYRWSGNAYNHDNKCMYPIELFSLLIANTLLGISGVSGFSQAAVVINDPNYIVAKLIRNKTALLITVSAGTYIPILLINSTYFGQVIDRMLNKIAAKIGDTPRMAKKRRKLINFLQQLRDADYENVNKTALLSALNNYRELESSNSGIDLFIQQLHTFYDIQQQLEIQIVPDSTAKNVWRIFSYVAGFGLGSIAAVPTYNLSYNLLNADWVKALTSHWLLRTGRCIVGTSLGVIAAAISIRLNYSSSYELLMSLPGLLNIKKYIRNMDYISARDLVITIFFSAFSGIVAYYLAYSNPMELVIDCKILLPEVIWNVLERSFHVINKIVPPANGIVSFALAFKSITEFLKGQVLNDHRETLRNASNMVGTYNERGEEHYQRRLCEAALSMLREELDRMISCLERSSGKDFIARLPSVSQLASTYQNIRSTEEIPHQTRHSQALGAYGTFRRRNTARDTTEAYTTNQQEAEVIELPSARESSRWWPSCCNIL